jgi:probable phosphoglycerate mutase
MRVHLIRHAQSTANVSTIMGGVGAELTETGEDQARQLGTFLASQEIDAVYSSPYKRARATAELSLPNKTLIFDDRLVEIRRGDWDGKPLTEILNEAVIEQMQREGLDYRTPGGESLLEVGIRMESWLSALTHVFDETAKVVAFTHGHAIRSLLQKLLGYNAEAIRRIQIWNTSITSLHLKDGAWHLNGLNLLPHQPMRL